MMKTLADLKRKNIGDKLQFKASFLTGSIERTILKKQTNAIGLNSLRKDSNEVSWCHFDNKNEYRLYHNGWIIFTWEETTEHISKYIINSIENNEPSVIHYIAYKEI